MTDKTEKSLWKQGNQYYLKLHIPRPLRQHFLSSTGQPKSLIVRPLGDSPSEARHKRDEFVVRYRRAFNRLSKGEILTSAQIEAIVALDLDALADRYKEEVLAYPFGPAQLRFVEQERKEAQESAAQGFRQLPLYDDLQAQVEKAAKSVGLPLPLDAASYNEIREALELGERNARRHQIAKAAEQEIIAKMAEVDALAKLTGDPAVPPMMTAPAKVTETISQAAEAWFAQMQNDPTAAVRENTLAGHRNFVRAFLEYCGGDIPLTSVTRAMASDFLDKIASGRANRTTRIASGRANRTTNKYAQTWAGVFKNARYRGRFTGDNPFEGLKRKVVGKKIDPFTMPELQTIFAPFKFEISPARHSPATALPWISLIALYNGLCLEEIAQMDVADMHEQDGILVFDVHNGARHQLKNERARPRLVPVHSALLSFGLLRYRDNLPRDGLLFPGLVRRASNGNKIGKRIGEMFSKHIARLKITQKAKEEKRKVSFHSLRKNAGGAMERGGASESDAGRVLGHALGMTFGTYSRPVLERVQETVERIKFPGLRLPQGEFGRVLDLD
jgi:integrase